MTPGADQLPEAAVSAASIAELAALSHWLTVGRVLVALVVLWCVLRVLDWIGGINFREWRHAATTHDLALYFGLRFLGAAILLGLAIS